jgi:hypothetical protein
VWDKLDRELFAMHFDERRKASDVELENSIGIQLGGKWKGYFAVSVDENYRMTFMFKAGHVEEVDYVDYH